MSTYVQKKFKIEEGHDRALDAAVEAMGGNVAPSFFVNLALADYFNGAPAKVDTNTQVQ